MDLSNNSLGDDGLLILKDGLVRSKTLKYLNLANTNISNDGKRSIVCSRNCVNNFFLYFIKTGANSLSKILSECPNLANVDLSGNNLNVAIIETICEAIKTNKSLKKVIITFNDPNADDEVTSQLMKNIEQHCAANKVNYNPDELDEIINGVSHGHDLVVGRLLNFAFSQYLKRDISIYNTFNLASDNNNNIGGGNACATSDYDDEDDEGSDQVSLKPALMRATSLGTWEVPVKSGRFSVSPVSDLSGDEGASTTPTSPTAKTTAGIEINVEGERIDEEAAVTKEGRVCSSDDDNGSDLSQNETDQLSDLPSDILKSMSRLMPPQPRSFRRMSSPIISATVKPKPKVNLQLKLSGNLESLDLRSSLPLSPTFFAKFGECARWHW